MSAPGEDRGPQVIRHYKHAPGDGTEYQVHHAEFGNFDELLQWAEAAPNIYGHYASTETSDERDSFTKTRSWEDAVSLAQFGWPEGAEKARKLLTQFEARLGDRLVLPQYIYAAAPGYGFDVSRVVEGDPEHWFEIDPQTVIADGVGQVIRVHVNGSASAMIKADHLITRGTAIACLVNLLELSGGFRCEVVARLTSAYHGAVMGTVDLTIKRPDEEMSLDKLAFFIAHPSALRRVGFHIYERIMPHQHWGTYGSVNDVIPLAGEITFQSMHGLDGWADPKQVPELVAEQLTAMGVTLR